MGWSDSQPDPPLQRASRQLVRPLLAIAAALILLALAWAVGHRSPRAGGEKLSFSPPAIETFFREQIDPLLDASAERDRAAAERAVASLHEHFSGFRRGVKPFVEDVTSWGTRLGVLRRAASDSWAHWWRGDAEAAAVQEYIQTKFRSQVISERGLRFALVEVLEQFELDLAANRNMLIAQIQSRLQRSDMPIHLSAMDVQRLERELASRSALLLAPIGRDSVAAGLASFAGSAVAEEIARRLATLIISRVAANLAASTAVAETAATGAAAAGSAAGGAATGTTVGPAGTIIGFGVGLVVGVAVDWWMTERFQEKLTQQCQVFLDGVEQTMIEGSPQAPGLRVVLDQSMRQAHESQRAVVLARVMEDRP